MQILLINTNPVVSRLMSLCAKETHSKLHEIATIEEAGNHPYDVVFIDDAVFTFLSKEDIRHIDAGQIILLSGKPVYQPDFIDEIIRKPFLPSQILNILGNGKRLEEEKTDTPVPQGDAQAVQETEPASYTNEILDLNEIERIKSLLEMEEEDNPDELQWANEEELEALKRKVIKQNLMDEGLEIIEDDLIHAVESDFALSITRNPDMPGSEQKAFEEKLLEAVTNMKVKKIKRLLKGATITINIQFKDEPDA